MRAATPAGDIETKPVPATAAGPQLRELLVGSEGVLGVITEATLRVRPLPAERRYEGWSFRSFAEGAEAFRAMEQAHASPDVARLSDEEETRLAMALAVARQRGRAGRQGLPEGARPRGRLHRDRRLGGRARRRRAAPVADARRCCARTAACRSGSRPGQAWLRSRYEGPYQRDVLLDHDVMVETLETATIVDAT